jgi:hypothetical protein
VSANKFNFFSLPYLIFLFAGHIAGYIDTGKMNLHVASSMILAKSDVILLVYQS